MKLCTCCAERKPFTDFNRCTTYSDGYRNWCKPCVSVYNAAYRASHREEIAESKRGYAPTHNAARRRRYASDEGSADRKRRDAQEWRAKNREKHRAYSRKWALENAERARVTKRIYYAAKRDAIQIQIRKWKAENPEALRDYSINRKARLKPVNGRHTREQIAELLEKQRGLCVVCEADIRVKRHRDHIVPLSAVGSNDISNIQLLCPDCNLSKRAKDMATFLAERQA